MTSESADSPQPSGIAGALPAQPTLPDGGFTIDLGEVVHRAAYDEMWPLRGQAIQAYASLEQSLFGLFALLTGMDRPIAGIVFFKITNAQARNSIIEKLFQKWYGNEFSLFRNSLMNRCGLSMLSAMR